MKEKDTLVSIELMYCIVFEVSVMLPDEPTVDAKITMLAISNKKGTRNFAT